MNIQIKKIKYIIIYAIFTSILFASCTKYLDTDPDTRIHPNDVEDYQAIITNAYPGAVHLFTEIMTDNYRYYDYDETNNSTIVSWFKPMYLWSDDYKINLPIGPEQAWGTYYECIYYANVVLEGIDNAVGDEQHKASVKGEAYLIRGYCHFMLVNLFAKHYDVNTANSDLGIPYVLQTEEGGIVHYERDNIAKVYELLEQDIANGIDLISEEYTSAPKFHFSKVSAYALMSRVCLYKSEWEQCILYSNLALGLNSSVRRFVDDYNSFLIENDFDGFKNDYYSSSKENILLVNKVLEWTSYRNSGYYANEFMNIFTGNDLRGKIFISTNNAAPNAHTLKFISQYKDGQQYSNVAIFTTEELLLNRAEANLKSKSPDYQSVIDDLNSFLKYRYSDFVELQLSDFNVDGVSLNDVLTVTLLNQRRLELCYEGFRWFDLKRFNISITHKTEAATETLEANDLRYVLQIPEKELSANELIVPNPR